MRRRLYSILKRFNKKIRFRHIVISVLLASPIVTFIPPHITGTAEKFLQPWLVPASHLLLLAGRTIINENKNKGSAEEKEKNISRSILAISIKLAELEKENERLLGIRRIIGKDFIIIPARLVGFDSLGLASIEINKGLTSAIEKDLPVLAEISEELINIGVDPQLSIASGVLVGRIAYLPGPYTSRVELITSKNISMICNIVRYNGSKIYKIARIKVEGAKDANEMIAKMVPTKHNVKVNDLVMLEEYTKFGLPTPVLVGYVDEITIRIDNRLLADLKIKPAFDLRLLDKVYILKSVSKAQNPK